MRFSIIAVVPFLLGAVMANYNIDCDDGKGNHEKYHDNVERGHQGGCKNFRHGMKNFDCYHDDKDGKNYKFYWFEGKDCKGRRHDYDFKGKRDGEHGKDHEDNECWSYQPYCYSD